MSAVYAFIRALCNRNSENVQLQSDGNDCKYTLWINVFKDTVWIYEHIVWPKYGFYDHVFICKKDNFHNLSMDNKMSFVDSLHLDDVYYQLGDVLKHYKDNPEICKYFKNRKEVYLLMLKIRPDIPNEALEIIASHTI